MTPRRSKDSNEGECEGQKDTWGMTEERWQGVTEVAGVREMREQENLLIHAMFEKAMVISGTLYAN